MDRPWSHVPPLRKEPDVRWAGPVVEAVPERALISMSAFFIPVSGGDAGERVYQELRRQLELQMGRPPNRRRIMELWTRRGNLDCVTAVGSPDPVWGGMVTAIFDMGPHQPFVVYRQPATDSEEQSCDVLGCNAYSVSEFTS
jgi:hypothetical protein